MPGRRGIWATLVGTVFAHRLFDLVPVLALIVYVLFEAKIPEWAVTSLTIFVVVAVGLFAFAFATAKRPDRSPLDGLGAVRRLLTMVRYGLGVMHKPLAAAEAVFFQFVGWLCQLFAVWTTMLAFHIHAGLAAAGVVLVLMNVATIFPLWPGNAPRPRSGGGRAAARSVRRVLRARLRLRDRAAGDRGVGRCRRRHDLPRARGPLVWRC